MSYSFLVPTQWDDFENMFDKLVTDRYGPPTNSKDNKSTAGSSAVSKVFRPKIDVVETDDSFIVTAELAGAKKDDIAIDLHSGRLTISGQTKSSNEHSEGNVRVSERTFGSFSRTIAVPQTVSHEQIKASFNEGVLQVTVPKVTPSKESQRIAIS
ncbi:HSP20-like chaperone [Phakopsora pachyrhizi]|uniref:HSP20-like chaperone n=1 Tax=Phakopsora pachyrhizi TaxID=170000 RepID=A0AAV0AVS1_PHAPC|nr:HSP20-like chaperone [Phakopsora pachyrhizi]